MVEFREVQRFRQVWIWAILIFCLLVVIYAVYRNVFVNNMAFDASLAMMLLVPILVMIFFLTIRLETIVNNTGVYYRFYPIHAKIREVKWSEVESAYVRVYNPVMEYGGWGVRYGLRSGRAFNIAGNKGLQIIFKDSKKLLIGTQKPEELQKMLFHLSGKGILHTRTEELPEIKDRF